jgi:succinate dehydrogenase / fumarate reductase flavoprotein subunit
MVGARYGEEWDGRLVTEAVRGEGGRLYNSEGERFMERYSPDQMELDARDVVARAIAREIAEGRGTAHGGVYLDISHRDRDFIRDRLPRMYERFTDLGVDMAEDPVEVAPTAHYGMGGVFVDDEGQTDVDGLYAIGETMGGVHGANRLGGNSLAETVAFGQVTGQAVAARLLGSDAGAGSDSASVGAGGTDRADTSIDDTRLLRDRAERHIADLGRLAGSDGDHDPEAVLADLRDLLWDHAGILRDEAGLTTGLDRLAGLRERASDLAVGEPTSRSFEFALNLGFALDVAEAVLRGALRRPESRGAHARTDCPETDPSLRQNLVTSRDSVGTMRLDTVSVGDPSATVQAALDAGYELDYHQLE